jgi:hypothetical protein
MRGQRDATPAVKDGGEEEDPGWADDIHCACDDEEADALDLAAEMQ